jgi:hypothetical protein
MGVFSIQFLFPMVLKGAFIVIFVLFLYIFLEKITLNELFLEILNSEKWQIFSRLVFEIYQGPVVMFLWSTTFKTAGIVGAHT